MKQVAELLGVELGGQFMINGRQAIYELQKDGVYILDCQGRGVNSAQTFLDLLRGEAEIVKQPWKPKYREEYYFLNLFDDEVFSDIWEDHPTDTARYKLGNVFKTELEAEKNIEAYKKYMAQEPDISWRVKDDSTANTNSN
ncbi:MAG: hypothetical protein MJZ99_07020 [Bacteroidales bacterium]|nr:hypothetical protein [Bacteroidales bacterium]